MLDEWIIGSFAVGCDLLQNKKLDEARDLIGESKKRAELVLGPLHPHVMKCDHVLQNTLFGVVEQKRPTGVVYGLKGRQDLNGKVVTVEGYLRDQGRYKAAVGYGNSLDPETICVKPSNIILARGSEVIISGLKSAKDLNGKKGVVEKWDVEAGRYAILLSDGSNKKISVKPENALAY